MATVKRFRDEDNESLIKRFKRKVSKEGIISDMKKHEFYQKPSKIEHDRVNTIKHNAEKRKK